jgi:hypothetical protein
MLLSLILVTSNPYVAEARCPNGYHRSRSGDCERESEATNGMSSKSEETIERAKQQATTKFQSRASIDSPDYYY